MLVWGQKENNGVRNYSIIIEDQFDWNPQPCFKAEKYGTENRILS